MGRSARLGSVLVLLALALSGQRAADAPATPAALKASGLDHFYNLEYSRAIADFSALTRAEPDSAGAWNHLAQAQLYQIMYRMGALESQLYGHGDPFLEAKTTPPEPALTAAFTADNQRAMALAEAAAKSHPASAQAHYDLAVAWALHGNYQFS